jgi:MoxR-like ATPase
MADAIEARAAQFREKYEALRTEIGKAIVGQRETVDLVLTAIFAGGHVLLEGLPGLGKTQLVKTLAAALDLKFTRIQCTPDLMPADILGTTLLAEDEKGRRSFEFQRGPIFGNIVLTDEINRATPKTQSALLQAMQESAVTAGNTTYSLDQPFFVLATQNPIELEGTYPLPEAQLDRFMFKLLVPPNNVENLVAILERTTAGKSAPVSRVLTGAEVVAARKLAQEVPAAPAILQYAASAVVATDPNNAAAPQSVRSNIKFGSSPRGAQAIILAAKVLALAAGRFHVSSDDVRKALVPALRHRLILNFEGEAAGITTDAVLADVIRSLPEPR